MTQNGGIKISTLII